MTASLRQLALALVSIFGPLYTLKIISSVGSFSFAQNSALVFISYILLRVSTMLTTRPAALFQHRFGFRHSALLGNTLLALGLVFLILAEKNPILIVPSVILRGVSIPFYWLSYHLIVTRDGHLDHIGTELSWLTNLARFSSALGPAVGGFIIVTWGFNSLYAVAVLLTILATLPLFLMPHHKHDHVPTLSDLWCKLKKNRATNLAFIGAGADGDVQGIIWPIALFLAYESYETLGFLVSVTFIVSIAAYFVAGKAVDKVGPERLLQAGSRTNALMWIMKFFVRKTWSVFAVDLSDRALGSIYNLPFNALFYKKAQSRSLEFMLLREWTLNLGRIIILGLAALIVLAGLDLRFSFWLAAGASLLAVYLISSEKNQ